jgi:hypothetical protein
LVGLSLHRADEIHLPGWNVRWFSFRLYFLGLNLPSRPLSKSELETGWLGMVQLELPEVKRLHHAPRNNILRQGGFHDD